MRLYNLHVEGFRRFEAPQNLNVSTKLTAIVGPNEAGKTSLLRAFSYFSNNNAISSEDITNLGSHETILRLSFFLDADDLEAAKLTQPSWLDIVKRPDGTLKYSVRPKPPRDRSKRIAAAKSIDRLESAKNAMTRLNEVTSITSDDLDAIRDSICNSSDDLSADTISGVSSVASKIGENIAELPWRYIHNVNTALEELVTFEEEHDPHQFAINILSKRVPNILNFTQEYREIDLPYDLALYNHPDHTVRRTLSRPLAEILRLSEIDIDTLKQAAVSNNQAVKTGLLAAANKKLEEISRAAWKQSDAALNLSVNGTQLTILVRNEEDFDIQNQFSSYQSRSDGYKQFIALQVFTFLEKASKSVLLIDELEQHLHYDAQADLIQVLQDEPTVGNVVYTTHSAGGLPEDLGIGVRMVRWIESDKKRSEIVNKFWQNDNVGGFRPLLFGMGATTFAFFPSRRALIAEGPTEMLLLPAMFREVLNLDGLDFQIVHGLSNLSPSGLPMVDVNRDRVCYVVDNDVGGMRLKKDLKKVGVPSERIFSIADVRRTAVTVEDLIEPGAWLEAVNRYVAMYGPPRGVVDPIAGAPAVGRIAALPQSIRDEKIAFAYNVLELIREDPTRKVVASSLAGKLCTLGQRVRSALEIAV